MKIPDKASKKVCFFVKCLLIIHKQKQPVDNSSSYPKASFFID